MSRTEDTRLRMYDLQPSGVVPGVRASVFWLDDRQSQAFRGMVVFPTRVPSAWRRLAYGKHPDKLTGVVASLHIDELTAHLDALQPNTIVDTEGRDPLRQILTDPATDVLRVTFVGHKELALVQPSDGALRDWTEQVYAHMKPSGVKA